MNSSSFTKVHNDNFYGITVENQITRGNDALYASKLVKGKYFKPKIIKTIICVLSKFVINTEFDTTFA